MIFSAAKIDKSLVSIIGSGSVNTNQHNHL
jgi:hypothetical protein